MFTTETVSAGNLGLSKMFAKLDREQGYVT